MSLNFKGCHKGEGCGSGDPRCSRGDAGRVSNGGGLICHEFEPVDGRLVVVSQALIGKVCNSFSGRRKEGRAEDPPHGEGHRESSQQGAVGCRGEGNPKCRNIRWVKVIPV